MAIDKKHTGAFARSRFGYPNFAESPKFARGSMSYDLSWRLEYSDAQDIVGIPHNANGVWLMSTAIGALVPYYPSISNDDNYQNWSFVGSCLTGGFGNYFQYQKGIIITSHKVYLSGIYDVTMQYAHGAHLFAESMLRLYGTEYLRFSAALVAVDGQEIAVSPADMTAGLDATLKPGILSAAYYPKVSPVGYPGDHFMVDARINTKLLFGRATQFRLKTTYYINGSNINGRSSFRGRSFAI